MTEMGLRERKKAQTRQLIADTAWRLFADSPALQAREQQAFAHTAAALADRLAADTGAAPGDFDAQVAANALVGVQRALVGYTRRRVLAEERPAGLAADVRARAERAFALLEAGLSDY